jgi:hypothetical protein
LAASGDNQAIYDQGLRQRHDHLIASLVAVTREPTGGTDLQYSAGRQSERVGHYVVIVWRRGLLRILALVRRGHWPAIAIIGRSLVLRRGILILLLVHLILLLLLLILLLLGCRLLLVLLLRLLLILWLLTLLR